MNVDSEQAASKSSNALNYIYIYRCEMNVIGDEYIYNLFKTQRSCISDNRSRTISSYINFKQRNGIDDLDNLDPF